MNSTGDIALEIFDCYFHCLFFILVSAYKMVGSHFSLSTSVYHSSEFDQNNDQGLHIQNNTRDKLETSPIYNKAFPKRNISRKIPIPYAIIMCLYANLFYFLWGAQTMKLGIQ